MTRADTRLSTPPLNTSSNNVAVSTADRVDSTRRAFLSQAAVVAAGGAALGVAFPMPGSTVGAGQAPEAVAPLLRRPVLTMDGAAASDELRSAFRDLEDAHETLKTAWVEYRRVVGLTREWEREHPFSGGGSNRAYRKWERRRSKYFEEIGWGPVGKYIMKRGRNSKKPR